ncbi:MAG: hypothetical protein LBK40_05800 [Spirochaetaceae bacterium]|jgi:hypothetical protein|nr:hypothetical protein [Spirochaetaceae bacterium]
MTNSAALKYADAFQDTSSARIFSFPRKVGPSYMPNTTSSGLIDSKEYHTKEAIEAVVYEILIKERLFEKERDINPFGSIYLCDLQPDVVDYSRIEKIKMFENIKDVSDSIFFDDGMDD